MEETATVRDGQFLRPNVRRPVRGPEGFQEMLKKTLHVSLHLLLLAFFSLMGHRMYVRLLEDPLFRVREVEVEGCQKVPRENLLSLARVEGMPNLFTVKLKEIAKRLETHPWIEYVVVRKAFPNKISIQIKERKPIAILQLEELYYIDSKGMIFSRVGDGDGFNYPFLTGLKRPSLEKDSEEAQRLITKALELLLTGARETAPPLGDISEIQMDPTYGIRYFTKADGVKINVGWDHYEEKLKRLSLIWSDLEKRGISAASIDSSDLNSIVVKKASRGGERVRRESQGGQERSDSGRAGHRDHQDLHRRRRSG